MTDKETSYKKFIFLTGKSAVYDTFPSTPSVWDLNIGNLAAFSALLTLP